MPRSWLKRWKRLAPGWKLLSSDVVAMSCCLPDVCGLGPQFSVRHATLSGYEYLLQVTAKCRFPQQTSLRSPGTQRREPPGLFLHDRYWRLVAEDSWVEQYAGDGWRAPLPSDSRPADLRELRKGSAARVGCDHLVLSRRTRRSFASRRRSFPGPARPSGPACFTVPADPAHGSGAGLVSVAG
jgi:hypothetical protein